jgi:hypothetical protein
VVSKQHRVSSPTPDSNQPDREDELLGKLSGWLEQQGYPLEMDVAAAFRAVGFQVLQASYYEDPDEQKPREIDLVATRWAEPEGAFLSLTYVVECKSSRSKPWILFTEGYSRPAESLSFHHRMGTDLARKLLRRARRRRPVSELAAFSLPERLGYGLTQALTSGSDVAYAAVTTVSKAARYQMQQTEKTDPEVGPIFEIVQPAVVIDGRLFEGYLDLAGGRVLKEVQEGTLLSRHPAGGGPLLVPIVTRERLDDFALMGKEALDTILAECQKDIIVLTKNWAEQLSAEPSP